MSYSSYKKFIRNFNFPSPDWDTLPRGFPKISKKGLTPEEGHLLDAITLAWLTTTNEGKTYLLRKAKLGLISLICLTSLISLVFLRERFAKQVSAATYTLNEVIESTMSAILRR